MFRIEPNGPNRLDITLEGRLDRDEMKAVLDDLLAKCEGFEHGRMLYRVRDFKLPTLGAIGVELVRMPKLLKLVGRFDKAAVLADAGWLKKVGELEGALIPGLEVKGFDPAQEAEAEAWLTA